MQEAVGASRKLHGTIVMRSGAFASASAILRSHGVTRHRPANTCTDYFTGPESGIKQHQTQLRGCPENPGFQRFGRQHHVLRDIRWAPAGMLSIQRPTSRYHSPVGCSSLLICCKSLPACAANVHRRTQEQQGAIAAKSSVVQQFCAVIFSFSRQSLCVRAKPYSLLLESRLARHRPCFTPPQRASCF